MLLVFVMFLTFINPVIALDKREYSIKDELMTYSIFYDSIDYMKAGKAAEAFKKFMEKKANYSKMLFESKLGLMTEKEFKKFLKKSKLKITLTKEELILKINKKLNQFNSDLSSKLNKMTNINVKKQIKEIVSAIQKTKKRRFAIGVLVGAGAIVGGGLLLFITACFTKNFNLDTWIFG